MRRLAMLGVILGLAVSAVAQTSNGLSNLLTRLPEPHDYVLRRISSYDRSGGNEDYRKIPAGETLMLFDEPGPGTITHIWITLNSPCRPSCGAHRASRP